MIDRTNLKRPDNNPNQSQEGQGSFNLDFVINRAKQIILTPKETWPEIKEEKTSIIDVYKQYVLLLAAIPAVCGFLGMTFVGITLPIAGTHKVPFMNGLVNGIVTYIISLGAIYISAFIIHKISPKFEGDACLLDSFKLLAYSWTPGLLAGVFMLVPRFGVIGSLLGLYGLFVFWTGITPMTKIPESKRVGFVVTFFVVTIVVVLLLNLLRIPFMLHT